MSISLASEVHSLGAPAEPAAPAPVTEEQRALIQAVKAVNAAEVFGENKEITFVMDRQAKRMVVRIVNSENGKVVDQIPPEYLLRLAEESKGR
jgi:uncharacterized FlaG/YvyC family protein